MDGAVGSGGFNKITNFFLYNFSVSNCRETRDIFLAQLAVVQFSCDSRVIAPVKIHKELRARAVVAKQTSDQKLPCAKKCPDICLSAALYGFSAAAIEGRRYMERVREREREWGFSIYQICRPPTAPARP